jgi:integrase
MNQTKGGLETGDVVVYEGALLSKEEAKARARADTNHTVTSLIERFRASGECRIKPAHLTAIGEGLGTEFVEDLSRATCLEFLEKHAQSAAPATFNRWRAGLHRLMSYAIEVDWRQDNPVTGIKRKSEKGNRRDRVLEVDEERALQAACDERSEALGLIFALCMATGARVGEITSSYGSTSILSVERFGLGKALPKTLNPERWWLGVGR